MRGVRLSPWSLSYFGVAMGSLALAELLMATGLADPISGVSSAWVLVAVHLTTIGWATLLILGALQQFVPVLTTKELASQMASGLTLVAITAGLLLLLGGFLSLPQGIWNATLWMLPVGGGLVIVGVLAALGNLGVTLARAWPWELPVWFIVAGLIFLFLTVALGFTFALGWVAPTALTPGLLSHLGRGLVAHVVGGLAGWLTLTAMGVAYKLLAMFTLSSEHRGWWGRLAFGATGLGLAAAWLGQWDNAHVLIVTGWILGWFGLGVFLVDMARLFRARKRRALELNARMGQWALGSLALALAASLAIAMVHQWGRWVAAWVFFWLYGWIGGLGLSQLYKIVPFLTWLEVYGSGMGKRRTPRVLDLVHETRDFPAYWAYFAAVLAASLSLAFQSEDVFRAAMGVALLATLDIGRALWRVRHPRHDPAVALEFEGGRSQ